MYKMQELISDDSMPSRAGGTSRLRGSRGVTAWYWRAAFCLVLAITCTQCGSGSVPPPAARWAEELLGGRFRCKHDPADESICLSALRPRCHLEVRRGEGLPQEPGDRLVLFRGEEPVEVAGPADLIGCVGISSPSDALEYLRFFSSMETVHLFADEILEIYESPVDRRCFLVCLPGDRWEALGFRQPLVEEIADGFKVTRFVIKPVPNYNEVTVFRMVQAVSRDGEVKGLSAEPVTISSEDLLYLGFPRYL